MENTNTKSAKFKKILCVILLVGAVLAAIKCIFVSIQRDEEYAITLAYRLIRGDRLLSDVWDPHQTSAFLMSFLEFIFIKVTGSSAFLVLFLRFAGALIHGGITFFLYKTLQKITSKESAFLLSIVYFAILPKGFILPEFSMMLSWFTTLLILLIVNMRLSNPSGKAFVFYSLGLAASMCMLVLSYPTCALLFPIITLYLFINKKIPNYVGIIFVSACFFTGALYVLCLLSYMSPSELIFNAKCVISSCGSHGESQAQEYFENFVTCIVITLAEILIGLFTSFIVGKFQKKEFSKKDFLFKALCYSLIASSVILVVYLVTTPQQYDKSFKYSYFFVIITAGFAFALGKGLKDPLKKEIILLACVFNVADFIAIILLTNLNIFTSVAYLGSGIVFALAAIFLYSENFESLSKIAKVLLFVMAFSLTIARGISYNTDDGMLINISKVNNIIRKNAQAKGVFSEYLKGYQIDRTTEEWEQYIIDGDCVLLWDIQSIYYLSKDVKIGSYTTISTPTYDEESVMTYWSQNPDAFPNVIIVPCWFGELRVDQSEWFFKWIESEFGATEVIDGMYFRYYIKR